MPSVGRCGFEAARRAVLVLPGDKLAVQRADCLVARLLRALPLAHLLAQPARHHTSLEVTQQHRTRSRYKAVKYTQDTSESLDRVQAQHGTDQSESESQIETDCSHDNRGLAATTMQPQHIRRPLCSCLARHGFLRLKFREPHAIAHAITLERRELMLAQVRITAPTSRDEGEGRWQLTPRSPARTRSAATPSQLAPPPAPLRPVQPFLQTPSPAPRLHRCSPSHHLLSLAPDPVPPQPPTHRRVLLALRRTLKSRGRRGWEG